MSLSQWSSVPCPFCFPYGHSSLDCRIFHAIFFAWLPFSQFYKCLVNRLISILLNLFPSSLFLRPPTLFTEFRPRLWVLLEKSANIKFQAFCSPQRKCQLPTQISQNLFYLLLSPSHHLNHTLPHRLCFPRILPIFFLPYVRRRVRTLFKIILKAALYNPSEGMNIYNL